MLRRPRQLLLRFKTLPAWVRALLAALLAWAPLVLLTEDRRRLVQDAALLGRFLVAVPLLVLSEQLLLPRIRESAEQVLCSELVAPEGERPYRVAQARLIRLLESPTSGLTLLVLAYAFSLVARGPLAGAFPVWGRLELEGGAPALTASGWWLELVSLPLFRYLLLRRIWHFLVWSVFLGRLSRLRLQLDAAHPDRCGGLGFLSSVQGDHGLVLLALGTVLSSTWYQQIAEQAVAPSRFFSLAAAFVVTATLIVVAPLAVFALHLRRLRWQGGFLEYGRLADRYVHAFERRWIRPAGEPRSDDQLLGTSDLQSLSDLINSVSTVLSIRRLPLTRDALAKLVIGAAVSMLPLLLAAVPLATLLQTLVKTLVRV